jgi:hypothetical protein
MKSLRTVLSFPVVLVFVLGGGAVPACQSESTTPSDIVTDTNTNWLLPCEDEGACGAELECRCGVCTEACQTDADCAEFGDDAVCRQSSGNECTVERSCLARSAGSPVSSTAAMDPTAPSGSNPPHSADASVPGVGVNVDSGGAASTGPVDGNSTDAGESNGVTDAPTHTGPDASGPTLGQGGSAGSANATDASTGSGGVGGAGMSAGGSGAGGSGSEVTVVDAGSVDGGQVPPVSGCDTAMDMAPCAVEGETCGGPCTDECSFCNMTRCSGGVWTQLEVFPAPCFDCGDAQRCNPYETYCDHAGEVFSCEPIPEVCSAEPSCECLEAELEGAACAATDQGFTVER